MITHDITHDELILSAEDPTTEDSRTLIAALDSELRQRYPEHSIHGLEPHQIAEGRGVFLVARLKGQAVACGAIRPAGAGLGEVKRMFVLPAFRRQGLARRVLRALESTASTLGMTTIRLETGVGQPEAIRLYESEGYTRIPRFGEYADDPHSVCFEKLLGALS